MNERATVRNSVSRLCTVVLGLLLVFIMPLVSPPQDAYASDSKLCTDNLSKSLQDILKGRKICMHWDPPNPAGGGTKDTYERWYHFHVYLMSKRFAGPCPKMMKDSSPDVLEHVVAYWDGTLQWGVCWRKDQGKDTVLSQVFKSNQWYDGTSGIAGEMFSFLWACLPDSTKRSFLESYVRLKQYIDAKVKLPAFTKKIRGAGAVGLVLTLSAVAQAGIPQNPEDLFKLGLDVAGGIVPIVGVLQIGAEGANMLADRYVAGVEQEMDLYNRHIQASRNFADLALLGYMKSNPFVQGMEPDANLAYDTSVALECFRRYQAAALLVYSRMVSLGRLPGGLALPENPSALDLEMRGRNIDWYITAVQSLVAQGFYQWGDSNQAVVFFKGGMKECLKRGVLRAPKKTPTPTVTPTATATGTPTMTPTATPTPAPYRCVCHGCYENKRMGKDLYEIDTPRDLCSQFKFQIAEKPTEAEIKTCQSLTCRDRAILPGGARGSWESYNCYALPWDGPYCSSGVRNFALTTKVSTSSGGTGSIESNPSGIACGNDCKDQFPSGDKVVLKANPLDGNAFSHWTGDCSGSNPQCTLTMDKDKNVMANFTKRHILTVKKGGSGSGTVTSTPAGINCGTDCTEPYNPGTAVKLTASPAEGSTFAGWSGACNGTGLCTVTMSKAQLVTATFNTAPTYKFTVTKDGNGTGTVSSDVAGISCGGDCDESFKADTVVALKAVPAFGSAFAGWSGACSGSGACSVKVNAEKTVNATFKAVQMFPLTVKKSGTGTGSVFSSPMGIDCGKSCTSQFPQNSVVTLTASTAAFSRFVTWKGACAGAGPCIVPMRGAARVEAVFEARPSATLTVTKVGSGTVSGFLISCGNQCVAQVAPNTLISLTATPDKDFRFVGWSGQCDSILRATCRTALNTSKSVTATFKALKTGTIEVKKDGTGSGAVTSTPAGISCGGDCSESYDIGSTVALSAQPDSTSTFTKWSGACSGSGTCSVTVADMHQVTATFDKKSCVGEDSAQEGSCCFGLTRCKDGKCKASCGSQCIGEDSNSPGDCCDGLSRCEDGSCRKDCASYCVKEGANQPGNCCSGLMRCKNGYCQKSCPQDCIQSDSNAPGDCCPGSTRCPNGYCMASCTQCVTEGSSKAGSCCTGLKRCADRVCRTSCSEDCVKAGSNAAGDCCSGLKRCTDGYCRLSCPAACAKEGENGTITQCCDGLEVCEDQICRAWCPPPCVAAGSNAPGQCCPPAVRGTDGYCKRAGSLVP